MKLQYNSPFVLSYALISVGVLLLSNLTNGQSTAQYFTAYPKMSWQEPLTYFRLLSHVAGHMNWPHLVSNFALMLLIGPILEQKYGWLHLMVMVVFTALITGVLNSFLFSTALLGSSSVVFMMILLSSLANLKQGQLPLTFVLVVLLFMGKELYDALFEDEVSQFAHIIGGICGSFFGFQQREG